VADNPETVFGPLLRLRARVEELAARRGLRLTRFVVEPAIEGRGHEVTFVVVLASTEMPTERSTADDEFERVIFEAHEAEIERRSQQTLDDLRRRLDDQGGFLD
jgi:hypothetical protein